jgi:hypothetical protein
MLREGAGGKRRSTRKDWVKNDYFQEEKKGKNLIGDKRN